MHNNIGESIVINSQNDSGERPYKCSQCDKSFSDNSNLIEHMMTHSTDRIYQCSQCDNAFTQNVDLKKHVEIHKGEEPYQCNKCDKTFSVNRYLVKHMLVHTREKSYMCSMCDKSFSTKDTLTSHMRTHTGEKPYQCSHCGKAFAQNSNLLRHMKDHRGEKPFQCGQCDKAYSRNEDLQKHMKICNGGEPYQCTQCVKSFSKSSSLNIHMRSHTGEKPYLCSQCGKAFSKNSNLLRHIQDHKGEKPFKCSECDKTFSRNNHLAVHMMVHRGENLFNCNQCEKTFSNKGGLTRHMKYHTGEKAYQCSQCDKAFTQKRILERHTMKHSGEHRSKNKSIKCINPDCEESFYHHNDLIEHLKLGHNSDLQVSQHTFMSMNDFLTWKEAEETKNFIYYSKQCATKKGKSASYMYYLCQKGGSSTHHYRKGEVHRKSSRRNKKGVVKTDISCPSKMKCKVDHLTGEITVTYIQSHNHQNQFQDTKHHPIPRSIMEKVKLRLISGFSAKEIFKELKRENLSASQDDSANNIQKKHISIRSIKVIADKLKSKKDIESEVGVSNDADSNNEETFTNIADISEEYYEDNNSKLNSETNLKTTTLKTIENIHSHLNDDKYRSLYLNRMSTVLEQLNSEIEAIKSNEKTTQDQFVDKMFTES